MSVRESQELVIWLDSCCERATHFAQLAEQLAVALRPFADACTRIDGEYDELARDYGEPAIRRPPFDSCGFSFSYASLRSAVEAIEAYRSQGGRPVGKDAHESCYPGTHSHEVITEGETAQAWLQACERYDAYIVAGLNERDGDILYNSAVVLGPHGHIGTFRKVHLWNEENLFFEPGNLGFPVFRTPIGRIGAGICYDGWFPETYRLCALQGADIICVPTNWVPIPGQRPDREAMANILTMGAAHSNCVYIACADRIGTERGQPFIGQSIIFEYTGRPIGGPASPDKEGMTSQSVRHSPSQVSRMKGNDLSSRSVMF
jgi:predicted amidohydrolase